MPYRPWTEDELKRARLMREAGCFYSQIDEALGRRPGASRQQLQIENCRSGQLQAVRPTSISEAMLVERDAREAARNQRTLTEDFCGDPPPGYSALHGKTGQR
jgi:hypothetical protein